MDVSNDLDECASINIVEVAEDIDMLRRAAVRPYQSGVMLQRCFVVADAYAASLVEFRNVDVMFVLVSANDSISRKACGATVRVVNDNDILDPE